MKKYTVKEFMESDGKIVIRCTSRKQSNLISKMTQPLRDDYEVGNDREYFLAFAKEFSSTGQLDWDPTNAWPGSTVIEFDQLVTEALPEKYIVHVPAGYQLQEVMAEVHDKPNNSKQTWRDWKYVIVNTTKTYHSGVDITENKPTGGYYKDYVNLSFDKWKELFYMNKTGKKAETYKLLKPIPFAPVKVGDTVHQSHFPQWDFSAPEYAEFLQPVVKKGPVSLMVDRLGGGRYEVIISADDFRIDGDSIDIEELLDAYNYLTNDLVGNGITVSGHSVHVDSITVGCKKRIPLEAVGRAIKLWNEFHEKV